MEQGAIQLRKTLQSDLETLFAYQADNEAGYMAAFVSKQWKDKDAYCIKWEKLLTNNTVNSWTILRDNQVLGSVLTYEMDGETQISYGVGREFWGQGVASRALELFLEKTPIRPLHGRAAFDNLRSVKVLTKCGFKQIKTERAYAGARNKEIDELVFVLDS